MHSAAQHKPPQSQSSRPVTRKQGPKPQPPSTVAVQSGIKVTRAVTRAARLLHAGLLLPRPNSPAAQASRARTMLAGAHSSCKCLCHPTSKREQDPVTSQGSQVSGIRCLLETRPGKSRKKNEKRKKRKGNRYRAKAKKAACGSPSTRDIVGDTQQHRESSLEQKQKPCPFACDEALIETHACNRQSSRNDC
jgi:hypothetical protein